MIDFPVTFTACQNGESERNYSADWWAWVKAQPQDAMLLWLRTSNWDFVDERWFEELIANPDTDLSIIAVIFWGNAGLVAEPGYFPLKIINNINQGYYQTSELWLDRNEFIDSALVFAELLREAGMENFPYPFPRQLLGPFVGRKASVPSDYGQQVEEQIKLVTEAIYITFHRSEDEYLAKRYKRTQSKETRSESEARLASLQTPLPENPTSTYAHLSDLDYLERYFCPLDVYETFKLDPDIEKRKHVVFFAVSAVVTAGYLIFAMFLWLIDAFSKSKSSQFGAIFALSVMAALIVVGLAMLWRGLKKRV